MSGLNYVAILGSTVLAFGFSLAWYILLARQRAALSPAAAAQGRPPAWIMPVELVRTLIVALVLAGLVSRLQVTGWAAALLLALILWVGFPVILLSGSVLYEKVPFRLAAIHSGDWLGKLVIIAVVVSEFRS